MFTEIIIVKLSQGFEWKREGKIKRILTLANSRANKLNNWSARKTLYLTLLLVIFTPFEVHPSPCIYQFLGHEYTLTQIWANWMMAPELRLTRPSPCVSCAPERRARHGQDLTCVHTRSAGPGHGDHNYVESKNAGPIWQQGRAIDNNECTGLLMSLARPLTDHYQVRGNLTFVGKWIDCVWTSGHWSHNIMCLF